MVDRLGFEPRMGYYPLNYEFSACDQYGVRSIFIYLKFLIRIAKIPEYSSIITN